MTTKKTKKSKTEFDFRTITSVEVAFKACNIDIAQKPDVSIIPERFREPLLAIYESMVVFEAVNGEDVPDYADHDTWKYEPRFWVDSSGVRFYDSIYDHSGTNSGFGSRFCTLSREKTLHAMGILENQFKKLILRPKK